MKLFDLRENDKALIMLDLFSIFGLQELDDERKSAFLRDFSRLVFEYFMGDKIQESLTVDQLNELMDKYPPDSEENVQAMMDEVNRLVPGVEEKYLDALLEVKAHLATELITTKMKGYRALMAEETDPKKKAEYQKLFDDMSARLQAIHAGQWELLLA